MDANGSLGAAQGSIELDADGALRALDSVSAGLKNLDAQSANFGAGWQAGLLRNQQALTGVSKALLGVGTAIVSAIGIGAKVALDFDAQMSAVGSVLGATGDDFAALREEALRLGADTTFSASEAASAMEVMGKAGLNAGQLINGAAEDILNLAAATGTDVPLAAETAAAAMNVFGVSSKEAANIISQSANASALDVNDWALAMKSAGPIAVAAGMSMQELAGAMIILGDAGIHGEVAATALRNIITDLSNDADDGTVALNGMGIATRDAEGNFRGLEAISHDLAGTWGELSQAQKFQLAQQVAGADGAAAFMTIMDAQTEAVNDNADAFENANERMGETGTAQEQAAARMDNLKGSIEALKGTMETIAITFAGPLTGGIRAVTDGVNGLLKGLLSLSPQIQRLITGIVGGVGALSLFAGGALLAAVKVAQFGNALKLMTNTQSVVAALRAVGAAMYSALGPSLLVVAAGALLYAAYKTNFLGFADGVESAANGVVKAAKKIHDGFEDLLPVLKKAAKAAKDIGLDKIRDGFRGIRSILRPITNELVSGWTRGLERIRDVSSRVVGGVTGLFDDLQDTVLLGSLMFQQLRRLGLDPVAATVETLGALFPNLRGAIEAVGSVVQPLVDAFQAFVKGNFSEAFDHLVASLSALGLALANAAIAAGSWILDVGVPAVTGWIVDLAQDAWGALKAALGWSSEFAATIASWALFVAKPALLFLFKLAATILEKMGAVAVTLGAWVLFTAAPAILKVGWTISKALLAAIGIVAVELPTWLLVVLPPAIAFIGWTLVEALLEKMTDTVVNLTDVTMQLSGEEVVFKFVSLGVALTKAVVANLLKILLVSAAALTITLFGWPIIVFTIIGGMAALILKKVIELMPDSVVVAGKSLIISITNLEIQMVSLTAQIILFVLDQVTGMTVRAVGMIVEIASITIRTAVDIAGAVLIFALGKLIDKVVSYSGLLISITAALVETTINLWLAVAGYVLGEFQGKIAQYSGLTVNITALHLTTALDLFEIAKLWVQNQLPDDIPWIPNISLGNPFSSGSGADTQAGEGFVPGGLFGDGDSGGGLADGLGSGLAKAMETALAAVTVVIQTQTASWSTALNTGLLTMQTGVMTTMSAITLNITTVLTTITSVVATSVAAWSTAMNTGLLTMQTGVMTSMAAINTNITTALATIGTIVSTETQNWVTVASTKLLAMQAAVMTSMAVINTNITTAMGSASTSISSQAGRWPGIIDGVAGAMGSAGYNAGAAAGFGVVNGLSSALGAVQDMAARIANTVTAAMDMVLQFGSPSRVTTQLGKWAGEGVAVGLDALIPAVAAAAGRVANAIPDAMRKVMKGNRIIIGAQPGSGNGGAIPPIVTDPGRETERALRWITRSLQGGRYQERVAVEVTIPNLDRAAPAETNIYVTPDSAQFSEFAANAKRGNVAYGAVGSMGTRRTMTQGARRPLVRS